MIYADHAATTKIDPDAFDAMQALVQEEYGNPSQPYLFARSAKKALDMDMLSASVHKFRDTKGIGFLYIKSGTALLPYLDGGAQESGMRAGTENVASIYAMSVALQKSCHTFCLQFSRIG